MVQKILTLAETFWLLGWQKYLTSEVLHNVRYHTPNIRLFSLPSIEKIKKNQPVDSGRAPCRTEQFIVNSHSCIIFRYFSRVPQKYFLLDGRTISVIASIFHRLQPNIWVGVRVRRSVRNEGCSSNFPHHHCPCQDIKRWKTCWNKRRTCSLQSQK